MNNFKTGDRVEWIGGWPDRWVGTVAGPGLYGRVLVNWDDHENGDADGIGEVVKALRHLNALDKIVEALSKPAAE